MGVTFVGSAGRTGFWPGFGVDMGGVGVPGRIGSGLVGFAGSTWGATLPFGAGDRLRSARPLALRLFVDFLAVERSGVD